jgi:hypothetical protein
MSICSSPNCELLLVTNTGTTIENFDFFDCTGNLQNISLSPNLDYYVNYCSTSNYSGNSISVVNLGQVEFILSKIGCCNNDKVYFGVPSGFTDFQVGDTIYSDSFISTENVEIKKGCYYIVEEVDYLLLPILDLNYYYSVIESPLTYISQECQLCITDYPCNYPVPTPTPSYEIYNPSIQPRNECDVITIFPMSAQCFSVEPTTDQSYNGSVAVGITGGTPPYTIEWENGNKSSAISNLGYGTYPVKITDFYSDFTIELVCSLGIDITPTPTPTTTQTPTPSITPTQTPTIPVSTPTPTPTPTPTTPKAWYVYSKCGQLYEPPTVIVQGVPGPFMSPSIYFNHNGYCFVFLNIATGIPSFPPNFNVVISQTNYFTNVQVGTYANCNDCLAEAEPNIQICQPFSLFNNSQVQQTYSYEDCNTSQVISGQPILPSQLINVCSLSTPVVSNPLVNINALSGTCP